MAFLIIIILIAGAATFYFWRKGKLQNFLSGGAPKVTPETLERLKKQAEIEEAAAQKIQAQATLAGQIKAQKDRINKARTAALKARQDINDSLRPPQG